MKTQLDMDVDEPQPFEVSHASNPFGSAERVADLSSGSMQRARSCSRAMVACGPVKASRRSYCGDRRGRMHECDTDQGLGGNLSSASKAKIGEPSIAEITNVESALGSKSCGCGCSRMRLQQRR